MPAISTKVKGKQLDQAYEYIMVARWLAGRVCRASGLLSLDTRQREEVPRTRRMGLLVYGQTGGERPTRSVRYHHYQEGRHSNRRLVLGPLQDRRLELGDGRKRLLDEAVDGVSQLLAVSGLQ
jgi:hypothetical protein